MVASEWAAASSVMRVASSEWSLVIATTAVMAAEWTATACVIRSTVPVLLLLACLAFGFLGGFLAKADLSLLLLPFLGLLGNLFCAFVGRCLASQLQCVQAADFVVWG